MRKKKVAVIGAGAGGLIAEATLRIAEFDVSVYERQSCVGGIWNRSVCSPIYTSLRTNLPMEIMAFRCFPFSSRSSRYPSHSVVCEYLKSFSERFSCTENFNFGKDVLEVYQRPLEEDSASEWVVVAKDTETGDISSGGFDAVVVANGHHNKPFVPDFFKDLERDFPHSFCTHHTDEKASRILVMHSKDYTDAEIFKGMRTVLLVGGGPTGTDVVWEIAKVVERVIWSRNEVASFQELPQNVSAIARLVDAQAAKRVIFSRDGDTKLVDALLWATGFEFDFPFLHHKEKKPVQPRGAEIFEDLFHFMSHRQYPDSLFFLGLPYQTIPFIVMEAQVELIASILAERTTICLYEESETPSSLYTLGMKQFEYMELLHRHALWHDVAKEQRKQFLQHVKQVYEQCTTARLQDPLNFRNWAS